ncbi:MAG: DUF4192 domain-containing protein [Propionibacteriaceae bacterium]|jgi:hypothetical protein|nr:DUF4192 domain-containing protein [Propionibacteriaceae bacterium]
MSAASASLSSKPFWPAGCRPAKTALRVRTPADLVAVVPHLLGFPPADSLVLLFTSSAEVRLTARLDNLSLLAAAAPAAVLAELEDSGWKAGGERLLALVYGRGRRAETVCRLVAASYGSRLDLLLIVGKNRWRTAGASPAAGGPVLRGLPVNRQAEQAGLFVAPSRDAVADAWAPPKGQREDELIAVRQAAAQRLDKLPASAWGAALTDLAKRAEAAGRTGGSQAGEIEQPLDAATRDGGRRPERLAGHPIDVAKEPTGEFQLTDFDYAAAALLIEDPVARERLWRRLGPKTAPAHLRFWTETVRRAPVGSRFLPLCVLGLVAWQAGEGAVMALCQDEAAALGSDGPVFRLLTTVRDRRLPPSAWQQALRSAPHGSTDSLFTTKNGG